MRESTLIVITVGGLPALIYCLAVYAYWGLAKKETLGFWGVRRGLLAIFYGVMYALLSIAYLAVFGYSLWTLLNINFSKVIIDLMAPLPAATSYPVVNLIFAVFGLMTFIAGYGIRYYLTKRDAAFMTNLAYQAYVKQRFYVIGAALLAIAALLQPGMPQAVLTLLILPLYLDPGANPYKTLQFHSR